MSAQTNMAIGIQGKPSARGLMNELLEQGVGFQFNSHGDDTFEFIMAKDDAFKVLEAVEDGTLMWVTDVEGMDHLLS